MRYIAIGLVIGLAWAAMQYLRGTVTEPVALAVPVLFCAAFGALLWGARTLVRRRARRGRG